MENWKPIPGFEGVYDASNFGRIRSTPGKTTSSARFSHRVWKTRVLKPKHPIKAKRHDLRVTLWKDGKGKDYLVARLVASAWHGVPTEGMTVNHKNGDYLDNRADNLEWVSIGDNIRHAFNTGLCDSFQVRTVLDDGNGKVLTFPSMSAASRYLGRNEKYISVAAGRNQKHATSIDGNRFSITIIGGQS